MNKKIGLSHLVVSGIVLVLSCFLFCKTVAAETVDVTFNENDRYDIYFNYDLIKSVKIIGTREINGVTFLVVTNSNLKSKGTEGFIDFESIKAILPTGYINASQSSNFHFK